MGKLYIRVVAEFDETGKIVPQIIVWEDGRHFEIDEIIDMRMCSSTKAGGQGMRYICRVMGKTIQIYRDRNRWFMEMDENGGNTTYGVY